MANLGRALYDALSHGRWLVLAFLCSLGAASLWSANIAALFPIIEVTLHGESLAAWNQRRIDEAAGRITSADAELARLAAQIPAAAPADQTPLVEEQTRLQLQRDFDAGNVVHYQSLQPWLVDWMPESAFGVVVVIVVFIVIGTVIRQLLIVANQVLVGFVSLSIARDIRRKVFEKALTMERAGFLTYGQSGFISHMTHTTDMLAGGVSNVFGGAISEPLKLIACLLGAAFISWRLLLASLLLAPVCGLLVYWLNARMKAVANRVLERSLGFHHILIETLGSILTVQACTNEERERERFDGATGEMLRFGMEANFCNALTSPVTEVLGIGMTCMAISMGAYLVIHRETAIWGIPLADEPLSISALMVFFGMLVGASDPVRKLSTVISGINMGMVAADTVYPLLDREPGIKDPEQPQSVESPHRQLALRRVTFGYHPGHKVLEGVDLAIPFGQKVAIIGPNGGGKSTLVNLLCRFYDPHEGELLLDGVSLRDMSLAELRQRIGLVTQHTELFNESVAYNIRYGRWDATDAEVEEAARLAHAHEFIVELPAGYHSSVGPTGQRLSGGQRQRIALARAYLRNPEIIILDEATSQIDKESERLIHESLKNFARGRTVLIITHGESALSIVDRILEVRHGRIEESAPPRQAAA